MIFITKKHVIVVLRQGVAAQLQARPDDCSRCNADRWLRNGPLAEAIWLAYRIV